MRFAGLTYVQTVKKYSDTVTKICIVRLQNWADAEDCYQNTFVALFQNSTQFESEEHLKAWLIRVCINECNDYLKKYRKSLSLDRDVKDIAFTLDEDKSDLSWALLQLKSKYRDIIYLHYYEGYKLEEIADILGLKLNTVKSLLKRGKDKLKFICGGEVL